MSRGSVLAFALACSIAAPIAATTYPPVTFAELITKADVIFVGEVVDVTFFPVRTRDGTIIKTRVIFRVLDPLFGTTSSLEVFEFLGGEWNAMRLEVAEMPRFAIGNRLVMFAYREQSINPIVGFTQGAFRVTRDASGVDRVLTLAGVPVFGPERIGRSMPQLFPMPATPISLADFRSRIRAGVNAAKR